MPPGIDGFKKVSFGNAAAVADAVDENTVAVMIEPIQGEACVIVPPPGYLNELRRIADVNGILLITDEVQTGVGRTGEFYAFEHEGVNPDIVTLGKGLGGGVPISAALARDEVACFEFGNQGGTYNGNLLMTAVGAAIVKAVRQPKFLAHVRSVGAKLEAGLSDLATTHGFLNIRGAGLLWAVQLASANAEQVVEKARSLGLLINAPRPDTLRFMPSLRVSEGEVAEAIGTLSVALDA